MKHNIETDNEILDNEILENMKCIKNIRKHEVHKKLKNRKYVLVREL